MAAGPTSVVSVDELVRAAMRYLARRAASTAQLRAFLVRRAARRAAGADPEVRFEAPQVRDRIEQALDRVARAGLLDDEALARTRAAALARKGLPSRRLGRTLTGQGFDPDGPGLRELVEVDDEAQALRYAERKRLGPFASGRRPPSLERDVRALVRAGFAPSLAFRVMHRLAATAALPESDHGSDAVDVSDEPQASEQSRPRLSRRRGLEPNTRGDDGTHRS